MSTDKDAMREKAVAFMERGTVTVSDLMDLLTAERADAVAQERARIETRLRDKAREHDTKAKREGPRTETGFRQTMIVRALWDFADRLQDERDAAFTTTPTPSPSGEQPGVGLFDGHLTVICAADYPVMVTREQGFYVVEVIDWPGCVAHGSTPNEAFENLSTVKEIWAKDCIERGIAIPRARARQPRADYDAGESGEKI